MIENFWILKYNLMVMFNIWNLIRLKQTSNNPQRFTTQVKGLRVIVSYSTHPMPHISIFES